MFGQVAQLLWDQSLASPDKQEELVKLGFIEVAAKHLTGSITTAAPLTGEQPSSWSTSFAKAMNVSHKVKHVDPVQVC